MRERDSDVLAMLLEITRQPNCLIMSVETDLSMGWRRLTAEGQPSRWLFVLLTRLQVTKAALNNTELKFSQENFISFRCQ